MPTVPTRAYWAPRFWGAHLLMVFVVAATVALGLWQYGVSHQHKSDQAAKLEYATPVALDDVMGHNDPFPGNETGRPVVVEGTWLPQATVFVANHQHGGKAGYWVATPLAVGTATDPAIYVVRGWVSDVASAPAAPSGTARLVGWAQPPEDSGEVDTDPSDNVLPELRMADAVGLVDQDLYSAYLVTADRQATWPAADSPLNDGTAGLVPASPNQAPSAGFTTGLRNFLYALEWWVFSLFAIYIWWRWLNESVQAAALTAPSADAVGDPESPAQERTVTSDS